MDRHDYQRAADALSQLQPRLLRTFPPDNYWFGLQASVQAMLAYLVVYVYAMASWTIFLSTLRAVAAATSKLLNPTA